MKVWIHQIKEAMNWQESNYKLKLEQYQAEPTPENLEAYVESYDKYMQLKGRYEQWHIDYKEWKETGEL